MVKIPYSQASAYEGLLESFRLAGEEGSGLVSLPSTPVLDSFTQSTDTAAVEFKTCVYLRDWPCRRLPRSKRLHVAISALEKVQRKSWVLTQSSVYLNYFVVSNSAAHLVQALHFDFVAGGQADHPFFHLHLSHEQIPEVDLRSAGFDLELKVDPSECWVTTRIPTPDMTLASVLYCLVADHFGGSIFARFADNVDSLQGRLPHLAFDALKDSLQSSSAHFKSPHWFAHMRPKPL